MCRSVSLHWYYTAMNGSYIIQKGVWRLVDQPEFFWDPCTTLLYKHKYKDLNNCLQSPEMFLYWIYTMNTSYLLFRWVCEGWQTSRSFLEIHVQLLLNTNIKVRTIALNSVPFWDYIINTSCIYIIQMGVWQLADQLEVLRDSHTMFARDFIRWQ